MNIRNATNEDVDALTEMYVDIYEHIDVGEGWTRDTAREFMEYWLRSQPDLFFVGEVGGVVIGGIVANLKPWWDGRRLFDGEFFIDRQHQSKGYGSLLFKHLLEQAIRIYDAKYFEAITFADKEFPANWYVKLGLKKKEDRIVVEGNVSEILANLK
jgi:GNAT superfamily N-acetyltransferase